MPEYTHSLLPLSFFYMHTYAHVYTFVHVMQNVYPEYMSIFIYLPFYLSIHPSIHHAVGIDMPGIMQGYYSLNHTNDSSFLFPC